MLDESESTDDARTLEWAISANCSIFFLYIARPPARCPEEERSVCPSIRQVDIPPSSRLYRANHIGMHQVDMRDEGHNTPGAASGWGFGSGSESPPT